MSARLSRFLAVLLLALLLVSGHCNAETETDTEGGDCITETDGGECANPDAEVPDVTPEDPNCPSRDYVIRCSGIYLDTNQNGKLERKELQAAIDKLPWYGRGIINVLGSVDKMMKKCDMDGDDAISMDYDMEHNAHQCLATCFKRRAYKGAFFPDCE
mmetsp:Transcript_118936/g.333118  ORF Transcript_118936/g.333118 Transcript_118936/m.333118 type:complete len:158 (+) Transcript_118936:48-521(+)